MIAIMRLPIFRYKQILHSVRCLKHQLSYDFDGIEISKVLASDIQPNIFSSSSVKHVSVSLGDKDARHVDASDKRFS